MTDRERYIALLEAQKPEKVDVIVLLEGDGLNRIPHTTSLWKEGYAPLIATFGNDTRREYGSYIEVKDALLESGIPESAIHAERVSPNTKAEADRAVTFASERGYKTMLVVTSPHHQYRAFLTFLKSMKDADANLVLINAPAPLSWTEENPWGRRIDLLEDEWTRIDTYQEKGDVASFAEGIEYLEGQKEKNV
jgi:uncharacterized SAM-binding protein YcdF (DUF218 family)